MNATLRALTNPRMFLALVMGFASGLPLLAIGSTLQAWMTEEGVDLKTIGLFALVGLPYTYKFAWSPVMDRFVPPFWGRRRGWLLVTQVGLLLALASIGFSHPKENPYVVALLAFIIAFFSASQDIVIDAYRRESLREEELGLGSSLYVIGYRVAMVVSGALALWLADQIPWKHVYLILAGCIGVGLVTTFFAPEPAVEAPPPRTLREAVVEPLKDFFGRKHAVGLLAFILLYKLGDTLASAMTTPFYLQAGYTKTDIAAIVKGFGIFATMGGGFLGGVLMTTLGMRNSLWIFGFLQAASTLGFSTLTWANGSVPWLAAVISFENLTGGMGTTAYSAFMASLTNRRFTATQYALLTSLMGIPRVIFSSSSGWLAESMGWFTYFVFCTVIAVPGLLLLWKYGPKARDA